MAGKPIYMSEKDLKYWAKLKAKRAKKEEKEIIVPDELPDLDIPAEPQEAVVIDNLKDKIAKIEEKFGPMYEIDKEMEEILAEEPPKEEILQPTKMAGFKEVNNFKNMKPSPINYRAIGE